MGKHPNLHLLALERTGWRRYLFGRWAYASEPFRRDIQRQLATMKFEGLCEIGQQYYPPSDNGEGGQ